MTTDKLREFLRDIDGSVEALREGEAPPPDVSSAEAQVEYMTRGRYAHLRSARNGLTNKEVAALASRLSADAAHLRTLADWLGQWD
jgi:hypothetical protein